MPDAAPPRDSPSTWDRISALFHVALDLDTAKRETLLGRLAAKDPVLVDQVRSLLASHEAAGSFLETPAASPFRAAVAPGDRLGPYRILEEIGRGGMGVVFRAVRDDGHFTKQVAIKLISPGLLSEEFLKRFWAERQILAILDHPHIARLIDGGTAPDGTPYLVMEHVSGDPLVAYCDEKKLGIEARLRLFLSVCEAVQFAHQHLVVHRDLKSDNIMVTEDGTPRLLDFGIAKLLSDESGRPGTVTAPMHRLLTPDYASPEQVRGDPVTVASDVYSLGVVLYELMTGSRPFHFETRTPEEVLRVITQEEPVQPSSAVARSRSSETASLRGVTLTRLRRRLSGDLDYIILKALDKNPARRYGSVEQLRHDIERYLQNLPVLARGRTTAYMLSRLVRRHRVAVATAGLVVLSLAVGLAGTIWQAHVARVERDRAQRRFDDVRSLAHAVVFDIHDAIANLPGSTKARETLVLHALKYLDRLSQEAGDDPVLQHELGVAYGKIGDVQGRPEFPNLGRTLDARQSYEKSRYFLQAASTARPDSMLIARDLIVTMQRLGDLLGRMGEKDSALVLQVEAKHRIQAQRARYPEDPLLAGDFGVATDRLSDLKFAAGDTLGALQEQAEALPVMERLYAKYPNDPGWRRSKMVGYAKMAQLLAANGDRSGADRDYRSSQALAQECVQALPNNTDASRDLGVVYGMRGTFLADGGEIDSALALYKLALAISEELSAADPSDALQQEDLAKSHFQVGVILMKGHRYRSAEERFAEAYRRYGQLAAKDTANVDLRVYLARSSREAGRACAALVAKATGAEASRLRLRAREWYWASLSAYDRLGPAVPVEDKDAKAELSHELAALSKAGGG